MESGGVLTKLGNCQEASPYFPLSTRQTAPNSSAKYKRNYRSLIVGAISLGKCRKCGREIRKMGHRRPTYSGSWQKLL